VAIRDDLMQLAIQIANDGQSRASKRKKELGELKTRIAEIEALLHEANFFRERLARFQPEFGGSLQCPRCWVLNETRSSLTPVSGTNHEDIFRCHTCELEFSISF
jgi:hypothetical protein